MSEENEAVQEPEQTNEPVETGVTETLDQHIETQDQDGTEPTEEPKQENYIPQGRFNQVFYAKTKAEERVAQLESQLQNQQTPQLTGAPTLEDCNYDDQLYTQKMVQWEMQQYQQQQQQQIKQAEFNQKAQAFSIKQRQYQEQHPDYMDLALQADAAGFQIPQPIAEAIMISDQGVKLHEYMLKNPQKIDEYSRMSPYEFGREVAKLEANFTAAPKRVSNAPQPINPIESPGGNKDVTQDDLAKMSPQQYYDFKMSQRAKK